MTPLVKTVTDILSLLTVAADIVGVLLLIALIAPWLKALSDLRAFFGRSSVPIAFLVAFGSLLASIFYSEVAGFAPCPLCWWQRIFLYPQVIILGLALWRKRPDVGLYAMGLSAFGFALAIYHTYLQFGGVSILPCAASNGVSCSQRYFVEFGYVTIPTMALTAFGLIILSFLAQSWYNRSKGRQSA